MDLGTANTLIYNQRDGVVLNEPSIVAFDERSNKILAIGREAKEYIGRTPRHIRTVRPLRHGVISEQFTLWGQVGSEVLRGILLVIPIGDSILYAEPVFLIPDTIDFPELRRIILADSRQVVMHQNLDASVATLVGDLPAVAPVVDPVEEEETTRPLIQLPDFNQGLRDAVDKLQEVVDQLRRLIQ